MTSPRVDYHTHICGTTIDAMLAMARERGIQEYGVTEHIFQLDEGHLVFPLLTEEGVRFPRGWYVETVRDRAARESGIAVRLGLEVDYVPGTEDAVADVLAGVEWDYLLGSIHEIDGNDIFSYVPRSEDEGRRLWVRYYEVMAEAIECGRFDVITHPVRNAVRNPHLPPNFDQLLAEVAAFARLHGVALELNGDDAMNFPDLLNHLAVACGRAGCTVSLGSDAHHPDTVGVGLGYAARCAAAARVPGYVSFIDRERRIYSFS